VQAPAQTIYRGEILAILDFIAEEYQAIYGFNLSAALEAAGMSFDGFADVLHNLLNAYALHFIELLSLDAEEFDHFIYIIIEDMVWELFRSQGGEASSMLRGLVVSVRIIDAIGLEKAMQFNELPIFTELDGIFGAGQAIEAFYANPDFIEFLYENQDALLERLLFDLSASLNEYFNSGEMPAELAFLSELLGGFDFAAEFERVAELQANLMEELLPYLQIQQIMANINWDDEIFAQEVMVALDEADLGQRTAFADPMPLFDIIVTEDTSARLNLFFRNDGDDYAVFLIEAFFGFMYHAFLVPPGGDATVQIPSYDLFEDVIWITIASADGGRATGEFALRLTHLPLGYE